jgi:hypothetical protein
MAKLLQIFEMPTAVVVHVIGKHVGYNMFTAHKVEYLHTIAYGCLCGTSCVYANRKRCNCRWMQTLLRFANGQLIQSIFKETYRKFNPGCQLQATFERETIVFLDKLREISLV